MDIMETIREQVEGNPIIHRTSRNADFLRVLCRL